MYKEERFGVRWWDFLLSLLPLSLRLQSERSSKPSKRLQVCFRFAFWELANASSQGDTTAANVVKNMSLRHGISINESLEILNMKREDVNPTSLSEVVIPSLMNFSGSNNILRQMIPRRAAHFIFSQRSTVLTRRFWMNWSNMGIFAMRMQ